MQPLKLVFAGTPAFSARHLQALIDSPHQVLAVYSQPDRASGRGKKPRPSPVKSLAQAHDLSVRQPVSLKTPEAQSELAALGADLMVVVAYGLILPKTVLEIPAHGCINVHASLLPRWRGAAPIERALLAGDTQTGVTIMQMDVGLDTGDMLYSLATPISDTDTRENLEHRLATLGCEALLHCLANLRDVRASAEPQDNTLSTYAAKLEKHEARVDWQQDAHHIQREIRAGVGRLPAWSCLGGQRIRLLQASPEADADGKGHETVPPGTILSTDNDGIRIRCGAGVLCVQQLQMAGKNPDAVRDALNARRELLSPGARFTNNEDVPS